MLKRVTNKNDFDVFQTRKTTKTRNNNIQPVPNAQDVMEHLAHMHSQILKYDFDYEACSLCQFTWFDLGEYKKIGV
ncbi:MAG: hypothetical protein R3A45_03920 [Bdellovibrionota bacterium]